MVHPRFKAPRTPSRWWSTRCPVPPPIRQHPQTQCRTPSRWCMSRRPVPSPILRYTHIQPQTSRPSCPRRRPVPSRLIRQLPHTRLRSARRSCMNHCPVPSPTLRYIHIQPQTPRPSCPSRCLVPAHLIRQHPCSRNTDQTTPALRLSPGHGAGPKPGVASLVACGHSTRSEWRFCASLPSRLSSSSFGSSGSATVIRDRVGPPSRVPRRPPRNLQRANPLTQPQLSWRRSTARS